MKIFSIVLVCLLCISLGMSPVWAQQDQPNTTKGPNNPYGNGIGLNIALTNSGFGIGAYYQRALTNTSSLIAEFSLGSLKDEQEQRFFGYFGESIIPNKQNYLLALPILVGVQKRLFQESIQDNFRPYVQVSLGPTLGWISPYYEDLNNNNVRDSQPQFERSYDILRAFPKGSAKLALGGTIAIGANFGISRKVTQGLRFGYTFNYFFNEIQLMEPRIKDGQRFFGTPSIIFTFGRLRR